MNKDYMANMLFNINDVIETLNSLTKQQRLLITELFKNKEVSK